MNARRLLQWILLAALTLGTASAAEARIETFVYKRVRGLDIKADVHAGAASTKRPVVVWIHGGALITGHRESVMPWMNAFLEHGYAIVSIDYHADTDVLYEQSALMDAELEARGVEHWLVPFPGAEHGLAGADRQAVTLDGAWGEAAQRGVGRKPHCKKNAPHCKKNAREAYRAAVEFVRRHLEPRGAPER